MHLQEGRVNNLAEGDYVRITFQDQGCGIEGDDLARIFDPYFTTKDQGSGLGLSSVSSIVRKHGGAITVTSELGEGATFEVYLPASMKGEDHPPRPGKGHLAVGSGRILVMDDAELVRHALSRMLNQLGYRADSCSDGWEAIAKYRQALKEGSPYRAVIMDLTIPGGMGGKEAVRELLKIDPEAKVIVSSGYSQDRIMADYRHYGFSGVMVKPCEIRKLSEVLETVL